MVMILQVLFFISLFMVLYVYMGYPCLAAFLSVFINRPVRKSDFTPQVTILIAAHNEQECIRQTIENKLSLDYPADKIEIIVVSDGSTDKTDEIVKDFASKGVKFLRQKPRAGKTSAINMAVREATGEILVFSDANSIYAPDALKKLVQNFADPDVGYVTGKMIYTNPDGSPIGDGCTAYMKYENCLRRIETQDRFHRRCGRRYRCGSQRDLPADES